METNEFSGWVKLFHPAGAQVTIPLPLGAPITVDMARLLLTSTNALLESGWLVNAPGLEDGEHVDEIWYVVRRIQANDKGETPIVDLYTERGNFRQMGIYLNDLADIQAFEAACGLRLGDIPLYEGNGTIERGAGNGRLDRFVLKLARPARVVWIDNPRWEGEDDKKRQKRKFVRWANSLPAASGPAVTTQPADGEQSLIRRYADGVQVTGASVVAIFDAYVAQRNQAPHSSEGLKAWYANAANKALVKLPPAG